MVDLFDGKPVVWSRSTSPDADLANGSLAKALPRTDGGCRCRWDGWKRIYADHGIVRSMSRKGTRPDNAAMEGFFGTLKNEFFHERDWSGFDAASFSALLDAWLSRYSTTRLKGFRVGSRTAYDTIGNRRKRLGFAA